MTVTDQLFEAITERDIHRVKSALEKGADIHALSKDGQGVIHATINSDKKSDEPLIDLLLAAGADINQKNSVGQTPMDYAMHAPHAIKYLSIRNPNGGESYKRPDEIKYQPACHDVRALFDRNAKASDQEQNIKDIRKALCVTDSHNFFYLDRNLENIAASLEKQKNAKYIPAIDAPAYTNNRDDPFLAFAQSYRFTAYIAHCVDLNSQTPLLNMMTNIQENSWKEYAARIPQDVDLDDKTQAVRDMVYEFRKQIIGPALLRGLDKKSLKKADGNALNYIIFNTQEVLPDLLTSSRRAEQLIEMSEGYHRNITTLHDKLNLRIDDLDWEPLLTEGNNLHPAVEGLEGYTIEHLLTGRELSDEGKRLQHCVGGYASACMTGTSHIFSIRDAQGNSVSTFEILTGKPHETRGFKKRDIHIPANANITYVLNQHYAYKDSEAPPESVRILDWFIKELENGNIAIQTDQEKLGSHGENAAWKKTSLLEQYLFHYKSDMTAERQQRIYDLMVGKAEDGPKIRAGRKNYLVSPSYREMPVERMLEETHLNNTLSRMCKMFGLTYKAPDHSKSNWQNFLQQKQTQIFHGRG